MGFQSFAILLMLAFYGCYFGKQIAQKKKGIQTDQLGKGKTGPVKGIEVSVKAASIAVPVLEVISIFRNVSSLPTGARCVGAVLASFGLAAFACSVVTMGDSWRAGVPEAGQTKLVTKGIYRISRNPAFLGFDLMYLGIGLMFFNWILFIASLFVILLFHLQIVNVEEVFLMAVFGGEYMAYREKVNRYLGRKRHQP